MLMHWCWKSVVAAAVGWVLFAGNAAASTWYQHSSTRNWQGTGCLASKVVRQVGCIACSAVQEEL
jgi:hypothetical protein